MHKSYSTAVLFVLISVLPSIAGRGSIISPEQGTASISAYYKMLQAATHDSLNNVISFLQRFVRLHPEFERAYLKLLEEYIWDDQLPNARAFFSNLAADLEFRRNSYWMLAQIDLLEKNTDAAAKAFEAAYRAADAPPTPALLIDYLMFRKQFPMAWCQDQPEAAFCGNIDYKKMVEALQHYLDLDFQRATESFAGLPHQLGHQSAMLFVWGNAHFYIGQHLLADSLWQEGAALADKQMDLKSSARFLMHLGILPQYYQKPQGVAYFDSSYAIAKRIGDLTRLESLAGNRAIILRDEGKLAAAEQLFLEAIAISQKLRSDKKRATWFTHYGRLLHDMNRLDEALKYYALSRELTQRAGYQQ